MTCHDGQISYICMQHSLSADFALQPVTCCPHRLSLPATRCTCSIKGAVLKLADPDNTDNTPYGAPCATPGRTTTIVCRLNPRGPVRVSNSLAASLKAVNKAQQLDPYRDILLRAALRLHKRMRSFLATNSAQQSSNWQQTPEQQPQSKNAHTKVSKNCQTLAL